MKCLFNLLKLLNDVILHLRLKIKDDTPVVLIQEVDRKKILPNRHECTRKSCRVGFSKHEHSIPETEVC